MARTKARRQRRMVTISVVAPVTARVIVERDELEVDDFDDNPWEIVELLDVSVHASLSTIRENLGDVEFNEMERLANAAEDIA